MALARFRNYSDVFLGPDQPLPDGRGSVPAHRAATVRERLVVIHYPSSEQEY